MVVKARYLQHRNLARRGNFHRVHNCCPCRHKNIAPLCLPKVEARYDHWRNLHLLFHSNHRRSSQYLLKLHSSKMSAFAYFFLPAWIFLVTSDHTWWRPHFGWLPLNVGDRFFHSPDDIDDFVRLGFQSQPPKVRSFFRRRSTLVGLVVTII